MHLLLNSIKCLEPLEVTASGNSARFFLRERVTDLISIKVSLSIELSARISILEFLPYLTSFFKFS